MKWLVNIWRRVMPDKEVDLSVKVKAAVELERRVARQEQEAETGAQHKEVLKRKVQIQIKRLHL